jgi:acetamidase/formamidase
MEQTIDPHRVHHGWDNTLEPVLRVGSGDVVHDDLRMAGHGQIREGDSYEHTQLDFDTLYHLSGPVWVQSAEPGDDSALRPRAVQPRRRPQDHGDRRLRRLERRLHAAAVDLPVSRSMIERRH